MENIGNSGVSGNRVTSKIHIPRKLTGVPGCVRTVGTDSNKNTIYGDRGSTFALGMIEDVCTLLPGVLQPLGDVLVEMMKILLDAY